VVAADAANHAGEDERETAVLVSSGVSGLEKGWLLLTQQTTQVETKEKSLSWFTSAQAAQKKGWLLRTQQTTQVETKEKPRSWFNLTSAEWDEGGCCRRSKPRRWKRKRNRGLGLI
jgi:hypothetical protein